MHKLETGISGFPDLFVCNDQVDVVIAKTHGLPYVVWQGSDDRLIKAILYHLVKKLLPGIDWAKVWNLSVKERGYGQDGFVYNLNGETETTDWGEGYNIDDWLVSNEVHVDIEEIEALGLMPKFLGDIYDCIKINISEPYWVDGVNKKTGLWTGKILYKEELPNLIILDVSGSIPGGISTVMLRLIDTIRNKCNAELIVTATRSYYWGLHDELPTPQKMATMCGWNNEAKMFYDILRERVAGRHFGHVFVFGDNDAPSWKWKNPDAYSGYYEEPALPGTRIDVLHNFHTKLKTTVGYAEWATQFADKVEFNTEWAKWTTR